MSEQVPLKERALNPERIARIGREVQAVLPDFDALAFCADVSADLPDLALKQRIARTARGLHEHLPVGGPAALEALLRSLPASPQAAGVTNDFGLHIYSPHSAYVAQYHLTADHLDESLAALRTFTRYFSAEDATRAFINAFPDHTMAAVRQWALDEDYRVRRLASESTRPNLPWSVNINLPARATLPILDILHADASRFVTTSVANHLRDLARTERELVLQELTRWRGEARAKSTEFDFISREALKSQLKAGWAPAYAFLGYDSEAAVEFSRPLGLDRTTLSNGDTLTFSAEMTGPADTPVHVMYVISTTTANGRTREKFHHLAKGTLKPGQPTLVAKAHRLASTANFAINPGEYTLALQVNGRRLPGIDFRVVPSAT